MPAACREVSTRSRSRAARSPRPRPIPSWSLVPPISMPSTQTSSAMRSARPGTGVERVSLAEKRRYRSSMIQWKTTWCNDSTTPMSSIATCTLWCARSLSLPPENPVMPTVVSPCSFAQSTALMMFGLLPDPEMARSRSPGEARFFNCSRKIRS